MPPCFTILLLTLFFLGASGLTAADQAGVGLTGTVKDVMLPGPELRVKPDTGGRHPLVLRITATYPHGTAGFRYDFVWSALEPGGHNLSDWLERMDGTAATGLPPVPVEATPLLPPGPPGTLAEFTVPVPELGGYRSALITGGVIWLAGLIALICWRKNKPAAPGEVQETDLSVADRLRPLLDQARTGSLDAEGRARLERLVLGFWRERLSLTHLPMPAAMQQLRAHPEAGTLLRQVEEWLHSGKAPARESAVVEILTPYLSSRPAVPPPAAAVP
jgi:hypothetical protein